MEIKIQFYKIATIFSTLLWISNGIITIGSISSGTIGIYINIVVGVIFMMIGLYTYLKSKNILKITEYSNNISQENKSTYSKLLLLENIFTIISITVGLITLSVIISRFSGKGFQYLGDFF